jgi:transposase
MSENVCVGIDVSKDNLEVAVLPSGEAFTVTNDDDGVARLVSRIKALAPDWIIMEASGKYEILPASALAAAGLPVVIVNARHARDYAKSTGQLAKTDKIDANLLAAFGLARKPQIRPIPDDSRRVGIVGVGGKAQAAGRYACGREESAGDGGGCSCQAD